MQEIAATPVSFMHVKMWLKEWGTDVPYAPLFPGNCELIDYTTFLRHYGIAVKAAATRQGLL